MSDITVHSAYVGSPLLSLSTGSTAQHGATGAGISFDLQGGYSNFTANVVPTAGTKTASVKLQGSWDGTNWVDISAASTSAAAGKSFNSTAGFTVGHVRLNVTAVGSTGTVIRGYIACRP